MIDSTSKFTRVLSKHVSMMCERLTSTTCIMWGILFLLSGVSLFFFASVNAQELEVDMAPRSTERRQSR